MNETRDDKLARVCRNLAAGVYDRHAVAGATAIKMAGEQLTEMVIVDDDGVVIGFTHMGLPDSLN